MVCYTIYTSTCRFIGVNRNNVNFTNCLYYQRQIVFQLLTIKGNSALIFFRYFNRLRCVELGKNGEKSLKIVFRVNLGITFRIFDAIFKIPCYHDRALWRRLRSYEISARCLRIFDKSSSCHTLALNPRAIWGEFGSYSESNAGLSDYEYEMGDEDEVALDDAEEGHDTHLYTNEVDRIGIEAYVDEQIATPEWAKE